MRKKLVKRLIWLAIFVILCCAVIAYMIHAMTGPAEGANLQARKPVSVVAPKPVNYIQLDGAYLSFVYPDTYTVKSDKPSDPNMLQQDMLLTEQGGVKTVVITVSSLPSGDLQDDASYHMRTLYPDTYHLTPQAINNQPVVIAKRFDNFELVAFWPHAGKLATIAISGSTANRQDDEAVFNKIVQSVIWTQ